MRTLLLCWSLALCASPTAQSPAEALTALLSDQNLDGARIGVLVRDLADGTEICAHDAGHGFMTASNMKLVTAAVAVETLGPEFRFRTRLVAGGPLRDGVLDGDLFLVGSGDPSLGGRQEERPEAVFERLVEDLIREHGLSRIRGHVVGDDDCQPDEILGDGWAWGYQSASYAAQVSGLCFAENCVTVTCEPAGDGEAPRLSLSPATTFLRVAANGAVCRDGVAERTLWLERRRAGNDLSLGGSMKTGDEPARLRASVENPCAYAAWVLWETLLRKGIRVDGQAMDRDDLPARLERYGDESVLAEHRSPPLAELLVTLLKVSQNLYAEQLIRAAGRAASGDGGMRDAAAHARSVLERLGVDTRGMRLADGSGLSRLDLVRPAQLTALLEAMWRGEHRESYWRSLPVAGVDGTLRGRFGDGPARGRIRAKTGYIHSVVALSGFVARQRGTDPPWVFSILVNNFTCSSDQAKTAVDRFVEALADLARGG